MNQSGADVQHQLVLLIRQIFISHGWGSLVVSAVIYLIKPLISSSHMIIHYKQA